jgi:Leucine-rich repeat (LRR) protein
LLGFRPIKGIYHRSHFFSLSYYVVMQLCYNQLTGGIPTQIGLLKRLNVLALQSNQLTGAIPASLGDLTGLNRLDLSINQLFGSIPVRLAQLPHLVILDVRNNSLSGSVPPGTCSSFFLNSVWFYFQIFNKCSLACTLSV